MNKVTTLQRHIEFKKISVNSKSKLKDIERYLFLFINSTDKPLSKFNENDIAKFLNSLEYSIRTINDIKAHIKVFIKWNYQEWSSKFRNLDKLCKAQKPQRAYEPEQMITFEELEKLVKAENNLMWKVYWLVMFYGGFRPSEACNLKWNQIFFEPKGVIIKLHTSKTNKDFYKSLPSNAEHSLKELKTNNNSEYVFPSPLKKKTPIKARSVCARLKRLSKKVLKKEVVPYQLRHSIATILYGDDKRKDDDTANQLGHTKSMKTTYMNLDEDKIKEKARTLWGTKLSIEEKDEIKKLKETLRLTAESIRLIIQLAANLPEKERTLILKKLEEKTQKLEKNPLN